MLWKEILVIGSGLTGIGVVSGGLGTTLAQTLDKSWRKDNVVSRQNPSKDEAETKEVNGTTYTFSFSEGKTERLICPEATYPELTSYGRNIWLICKSSVNQTNLSFESEGFTPKKVTCAKQESSNESFQCTGEDSKNLKGSKHY
ncbi:hypothetical protein MHLP_02500 [Candidatus Mycoplasma haematolamae str. Purdue]|uniref:Uncharacterized protein n=1 Tax=Mycoplasma haematolamae (strain Purdue) TaxID=1212765 RepID=I7B9X8_MYCHA|nr:hypothetical protein [Candidatus Mycoplasma haematolamae]AFO52080.1 hypothetical protein MHLP_02500 [Candidatus Mycoplasma haematolamae str. Purdue]